MTYKRIQAGGLLAIVATCWLAVGCDVKQPATAMPESTPAASRTHSAIASASARRFVTTSHDLSHDRELGLQPLATYMSAHLDRAQLDPDYGFALAMQLQECVTQDGAVDALAEADLSRLSPEAKDALLQQASKAEAHCKGVENSPKQRFELVDRAAAAGIIEAQVAFRALAADFFQTEEIMVRPNAIEEFKAKTVRYATVAAQSGQPAALYNAYDVTSNPMFGRADPVTSLAYLLAYDRVSSGKAARLIPIAQRNLSAAQRASAQRMAQQLLVRH